MQLTFNKRSILPDVYKKDDKVYFSTTLFTPVRYNIKFGQGLMPIEQMKAVLDDCAENAQEVEIEFTESQGRFGSELTIFSVKPLPKKNPMESKA
ncbi:hypothetical protein A1F17_RS19250 [Acinetobacter baumannii]|uniref:hypothetical protein n=1 Tax=Acinetobacter baumannii TaxID=470 RepID=UPI00074321A3|nr:hypothetical protein [Acinetobacter baumannii]ASF77359.1 hypothetical protein CBI29_01981 [Acinetobacter baumannii]ASF77368.1 hypothetical protein CBI29_01990 [Acinetobacter baumannii]EHU1831277.1 hypothetical protein [Acinetobacter baumannii]EHU2059618.1 hypothetical protein [Acinetobacter baumannii]EHU2068055.1 hypothetical protein [Acinetobacter baumannii]